MPGRPPLAQTEPRSRLGLHVRTVKTNPCSVRFTLSPTPAPRAPASCPGSALDPFLSSLCFLRRGARVTERGGRAGRPGTDRSLRAGEPLAPSSLPFRLVRPRLAPAVRWNFPFRAFVLELLLPPSPQLPLSAGAGRRGTPTGRSESRGSLRAVATVPARTETAPSPGGGPPGRPW